MKRGASSRLSGKSPMQAKKIAGNVNCDQRRRKRRRSFCADCASDSDQIKVLDAHWAWDLCAAKGKLSPHMMDVRIHKCLYTKDNDKGGNVGEPTGNFMLAVSTPMGPAGDRGKWLPIWKSLMDSARLNQNIQCVLLFSPRWDASNCDMRHSKFKMLIKCCVRG